MTINHKDGLSESYREQLSSAIFESGKLGFSRTPLISEQTAVLDSTIVLSGKLVNEVADFLKWNLPQYWGNSCQTLSTCIFALLNSQGIAADIVLGNVIVNGTNKFETTLKVLQDTVRARGPLAGHQEVHSWVSLGDDTVIDAWLPFRLGGRNNVRTSFDNAILIGRASEIFLQHSLDYRPLLVGAEFFAKTGPQDPLNLLNELVARLGSSKT